MPRVQISKEIQFVIYGIFSGEECLYVGKTQDLDRRWKDHQLEAHKYGTVTPLYSWMRRHPEAEIRVLESGEGDGWVERERYWIAALSPPKNQTEGGEYFELTEEAELRRRHSLQGNSNASGSRTQEFKESQSHRGRGRVATKETREKMSRSRKEYLRQKGELVFVECTTCGKSFQRSPSHLRPSGDNYCTKNCWYSRNGVSQ